MQASLLLSFALIVGLGASPAWAQRSGPTGNGGVSDRTPPKSGMFFNPQDPRNAISVAIAAYDHGDFSRAATMFDEALEDSPDDPNLLTYKAMAFEGAHNYVGARNLLVHALRVDGENLDAHRELGLTYAALKDSKGFNIQLAWLRTTLAACPAKCADPDKVKRAVDSVEKAGQPPTPRAG